MGPDDWLALFNLLSLLLFVLAVIAGLGRMVRRVIELRRFGAKIPRLLKRDVLLFVAFAVVFGVGGFIRRVFGSGLTTDAIWVVPVSVFSLIAIFYWVRVEYTIESE